VAANQLAELTRHVDYCHMKRVLCLLTLVLVPAGAMCKEPIAGAGDTLQYAMPAAALGTTYLLGDDDGRVQFCKAALTSLGLTQGLKWAVQETRPTGHHTSSFPSGHTSASFSAASFVQRRWGWSCGAPAYALATYVGWSRVDLKAHFAHDVLAGAAIGIVSTYWFTTPLSEKISVGPMVMDRGVGIGFKSEW